MKSIVFKSFLPLARMSSISSFSLLNMKKSIHLPFHVPFFSNNLSRGFSTLPPSLGRNEDKPCDNQQRDLSIYNQHINSFPVFLYMKGSPEAPACGFSQLVSAILTRLETKYEYYDVLGNDSFRENIKKFSQWNTFPQLYINGKLIGGADIVKEMFLSGDLENIISSLTSKNNSDTSTSPETQST